MLEAWRFFKGVILGDNQHFCYNKKENKKSRNITVPINKSNISTNPTAPLWRLNKSTVVNKD